MVKRYRFHDETEQSSAFVRADVETFAQDGESFVLASDYDALLAENERLRGLLDEAIIEIEDWAGYASEYFQDKHDLNGTLAKFRAALAGKP